MNRNKGNKMDKRIFVEKKADFRVKSDSLVKELQHNLQLKTLKGSSDCSGLRCFWFGREFVCACGKTYLL